jgi:hypothetical protein
MTRQGSPVPLALFGALLLAVACSARPTDGSAPGENRGTAHATTNGTSPAGTAPTTSGSEITRERAIEIARAQVSFEPEQVEAEKTEQEGRAVWKVTFRGQPPGPGHAIGEYMEVLVDRHTGEIVGLAMS